MAKWQGKGLQNPDQRSKSARRLNETSEVCKTSEVLFSTRRFRERRRYAYERKQITKLGRARPDRRGIRNVAVALRRANVIILRSVAGCGDIPRHVGIGKCLRRDERAVIVQFERDRFGVRIAHGDRKIDRRRRRDRRAHPHAVRLQREREIRVFGCKDTPCEQDVTIPIVVTRDKSKRIG